MVTNDPSTIARPLPPSSKTRPRAGRIASAPAPVRFRMPGPSSSIVNRTAACSDWARSMRPAACRAALSARLRTTAQPVDVPVHPPPRPPMSTRTAVVDCSLRASWKTRSSRSTGTRCAAARRREPAAACPRRDAASHPRPAPRRQAPRRWSSGCQAPECSRMVVSGDRSSRDVGDKAALAVSTVRAARAWFIVAASRPISSSASAAVPGGGVGPPRSRPPHADRLTGATAHREPCGERYHHQQHRQSMMSNRVTTVVASETSTSAQPPGPSCPSEVRAPSAVAANSSSSSGVSTCRACPGSNCTTAGLPATLGLDATTEPSGASTYSCSSSLR